LKKKRKEKKRKEKNLPSFFLGPEKEKKKKEKENGPVSFNSST
jgi:hypothetical protein